MFHMSPSKLEEFRHGGQQNSVQNARRPIERGSRQRDRSPSMSMAGPAYSVRLRGLASRHARTSDESSLVQFSDAARGEY